MRRRVVLSSDAARDLIAAREWLSQPGSGRRAAERLARIRAAIRELRVAPMRWPHGDHPPIREVTAAGYRILFQVEPDRGDMAAAGIVRVLRVFGPGQDRSDPPA